MDNAWIEQLTGRDVEAVEQWEALPCVVRLSGGFLIQVESLWRLLSGGRLKLTSRDDGQQFGLPAPVQAIPALAAAIVGRRVAFVRVTEGTADLTISLGDITLEVIAESSGYEAWQVEGPQGTIAVGMGGGEVAVSNLGA